MTSIPTDAVGLSWMSAAIYLVPALVWAILAERTWWIRRTRRPNSRLYDLLPLVTGCLGVHYFLSGLTALYPTPAGLVPPLSLCVLGVARDTSLIFAAASARHLLRYFPDDEDPPSTGWLVAVYGSAALVGLAAVVFANSSWLAYQIFYEVFLLANVALATMYCWRVSGRGGWGHAGLSSIRTADVLIFTAGLFVAGVLVHGNSLGEVCPWKQTLWVVLGNAGLGLLLAIPFAMRMLGEVLRTFLVAACLISATFATYFGGQFLLSHASDDVQRVGTASILLLLLVVLGPGQRWLRSCIDRLGFRRSKVRESQLHAVLHTLSPELGAVECMRRALAEFIIVMEAKGAAVLLSPERTVVRVGNIETSEIRNAWPEGSAADSLYVSGLGLLEMRELSKELREPLMRANVVGIFPITSPRRRWGHLFMTSGLLGTVITDEDGDVIHAFTDQLALVLDSTELLERAVSVERSLAHAEKLSAIGELAARIAHEIRNPVTAARSLAQSLCAEPDSPDNPEHAEIILTELERVERQIAALLRFARRDELRPEPVDLGSLVRETVDQFHLRLEGAGIGFDLEAPDGIVAEVDREKIRQVLINLIENSIDAVVNTSGERTIALRVGRENGSAEVSVSDSGPGVSEDSLPKLFEPFFSLKTQGTGLGLAIVKRTVEAHGGQVHAESGPGSGLAFRVGLPIANNA